MLLENFSTKVLNKHKTDTLNYIVIYELLFSINIQVELANITPNIWMVMPEKLETVYLHT